MDRDSKLPLYPQVYPQGQITSKDNMDRSGHQSSAPPAPSSPLHLSPMLLGPENTVTTCNFCHASIKTAVKYTSNTRTSMAAALWCLACCMCCIPYSSDSCKNADHYCPNCQRYLGTYHK